MVMLPMDTLMKYQVSQESVLRGVDNENMRTIAFEVASRANSHLEKVIVIIYNIRQNWYTEPKGGHCYENLLQYHSNSHTKRK